MHLGGRRGPPGPCTSHVSHDQPQKPQKLAPALGGEKRSAERAKKSPPRALRELPPHPERSPPNLPQGEDSGPFSLRNAPRLLGAPIPPAGQDVWLSLTDFTSRRSPLGTAGGSGGLRRSCRWLWLRRTRLAVSMTTSVFRLSAAMARSSSSSSLASQASLVLLSNSWKVLVLLAFTGVVGTLGVALSRLRSKGRSLLVLPEAREDPPQIPSGRSSPGGQRTRERSTSAELRVKLRVKANTIQRSIQKKTRKDLVARRRGFRGPVTLSSLSPRTEPIWEQTQQCTLRTLRPAPQTSRWPVPANLPGGLSTEHRPLVRGPGESTASTRSLNKDSAVLRGHNASRVPLGQSPDPGAQQAPGDRAECGQGRGSKPTAVSQRK